MIKQKLLQGIDWFIPPELQVDTASLWQGRIFTISHIIGPINAVVILGYLYRVDPAPGLPFWMLAVVATTFWTLPFALKLGHSLSAVALYSVCALVFLSVFGAFFYGGVSSPFLPWFLTALLLGFFYLGDRPKLVLGIFATALLGFCAAHGVLGGFPELVPVEALSGVGVISVCAATLYTSMMAVYYANVVTAQSELKREADRHQVTAARMRQAKEAAERANEAKSVFLAKMSHHLRTPLNAVIGYSEILLEDAERVGDDTRIADLKRINSAGSHLLSLVTDVLDMSKIGAADMELTVKQFDLGKFVEDVASTCRSLVERNGNQFLIEQSRGLGRVVTDETRLRQVVINLLSNAGKFTSKGRVTLRVDRVQDATGEHVVIAVQDTGIGISMEHQARLFTDFSQAEASTSSTYGGTGLGLALSRRLCHLMHGDIAVVSQMGKGSTFTVRVPAGGEPRAVPKPALVAVAA